MRRSRTIAALAILSGGCVDTVLLNTTAVEGTQSVVWVAERDGVASEVWAFEAEHNGLLPFRTGDRVSILYYPQTLRELRLQSGRIEPSDDELRRRALPTPRSLNIGTIGEDGWSKLEMPLGDASPAVRAFRYADLSPRECAMRSGCYAEEVDLDGLEVCTLPCPRAPDPIAPDAAEKPRFVCDAPWIAEDLPGDDTEYCTPPRGTCPQGQVYFPNGDCRAVGAPCPPAGEWSRTATIPPDALFVRAGAPEGGSGTRQSPYGRIEEALLIAPGGRPVTIALTAGSYRGAVVGGDVTIIGACAAETLIDEAATALVVAEDARLAVTDLSVRGATGFDVLAGATLELTGVKLPASTISITATTGATIHGSEVEITGPGTYAIYVIARDVELRFDHLIVDGVLGGGIVIDGRVRLSVSSSRFARPVDPAAPSTAMFLAGGVDATIEETRVEGFAHTLFLSGSKARVDHLAAYDASVAGITVIAASSATVSESLLVDTGEFAISASGSNTKLNEVLIVSPGTNGISTFGDDRMRMDDVMIDSPHPSFESYALWVRGKSELEANHVWIRNPAHGGVKLDGASTATITNLIVSSQSNEEVNDALAYLSCEGALLLSHARFENAPRDAIVTQNRCRMRLSDITINRAQNRAFEVSSASTATVSRVRITESRADDIATKDEATLAAEEVYISGALRSLLFENRLDVQDRSRLTVTNFLFDPPKPIGIVLSPEADAELYSGQILGTAQSIRIIADREEEIRGLLNRVYLEGDVDLIMPP